MPKSVRTQIIEAIEAALWKIKAGNLVPNLAVGSPHKFLSTVRSVQRAMYEVSADKIPVLYLVDPTETGRHLLADVLQQTLRVTVAGYVEASPNHESGRTGKSLVEQLDNLIDDTRAVLVSNPHWNGLSRRSRLLQLEAETSVDEPHLAFSAVYEVDYVEAVDTGAGTTIVLPDALPTYQASPYPLPIPQGENVLNALFNAFLSIPDLVWVERPLIWPLPVEQVSARYTPAVFFHETNETYQYNGSTDTKKLVSVTAALLAVNTDVDTFDNAIDSWVAALKNCLSTYADLNGIVATVDLLALRTGRCEYPVVNIELDLQIMYIQSFTVA